MKKGAELRVKWDGPISDVHMHPRILYPEKAGIDRYSATAVRNGFTQGLAMLNEYMSMPDPNSPNGLTVEPRPINNARELGLIANMVTQQSRMRTGLILLVDQTITHTDKDSEKFTTRKIKKEFADPRVGRYAAAAKVFVDESFGGFNIKVEEVPAVAREWHKNHPGKPLDAHAEGSHVREILENSPPDIPWHICHVSSRQELEAVIEAKEAGKDVTCEVTPHHLFLTELTSQVLGARGCMKPKLKTLADQQFLWANRQYIDIFASDCAPHRLEDKIGPDGKDLEKPAPGVTNHDVFLPLFFGAVLEGKLTLEELYEKVVINPIKRFNLPWVDSRAEFALTPITAEEAAEHTEYGYNPFLTSPETPNMRGKIIHLSPEIGCLAISHGIWTPPTPRRSNLIQFS